MYKALKHEKVIDPTLDEIKALQDMGVWEVVPVAECIKKTQKKPIRGREQGRRPGGGLQVQVRRGGAEAPARWSNARWTLCGDATTLKMMWLLLSYVASRQSRKLPHKFMFIDISMACLHADVLNDSIFVELPGEVNVPDMCGRLLRALYGTCQAARAWEEECIETLQVAGFQRVKCNHACTAFPVGT